jgi:hypothetical protein
MPSAPVALRALLAIAGAGVLALAGPLGCAGPLGPSPGGQRPPASRAGAAGPPGAAGSPAEPTADAATGARIAFKVNDRRITESSGLAASRRHRGVVYTHNDSGTRPQIFAVGPDGRTIATLTLAGAGARDWEGIALGRDEAGRPALYVADIGDNLGGAWPYVTVYRIPEPAALRSQTLRATAFRLKYADGPRDAEAVLIDPRTNRLYVASKLLTGTLYAAPRRLRAGGRANVLRKVGPAPVMATDGAYAPDGSTFAIRTYFAVNIYTAPGKLLEVVRLPEQEQGESITYAADGRALLVGSEFPRQPVWRVPLPAGARPTPPAPPRAARGARPGGDAGDYTDDPGTKAVTMLLVAALVATGVVVALRRRPR